MSKATVMDTQDTVFSWLRDAHAMEEQSIKVFEDLQSRLEHYPTFQERVKQYLFETNGHGTALEARLKHYDESTSTVKDIAAKAAAFYQSVSGMLLDDEVIKTLLSAYTFIQMKIASYRILVSGAQTLRDTDTIDFCQVALDKEESMGEWLKLHINDITSEYLRRSLSEYHEAKR